MDIGWGSGLGYRTSDKLQGAILCIGYFGPMTQTLKGQNGPVLCKRGHILSQGYPIVCHGGPRVRRFSFQPITTAADFID